MSAELTDEERMTLGGPGSAWLNDDWDGLLADVESIVAAHVRRALEDAADAALIPPRNLLALDTLTAHDDRGRLAGKSQGVARASEPLILLRTLTAPPSLPDRGEAPRPSISDEAEAAVKALNDAADDIIAEMVCCHIYEEAGEHPEGRGAWMKENKARYRNHDLCYWAGACAHLLRARPAAAADPRETKD